MTNNTRTWRVTFHYDGGGSSTYVPYETTIVIFNLDRDTAVALAAIELYKQSQNIQDFSVTGVEEAT